MKNKTVVLIVIFALAGVLGYFMSSNRDEGAPVREGTVAAPAVRVLDAVTGKELPAEDLRGKVLFVNIWATWCQPCKEEMPSIEALYREMSQSEGFRMITILFRDSPENALGYLKSQGYTFPVYTDPGGATARNYGVTGVPETYIVDKKGMMVKKVIGGLDWNSPEAKEFLQALVRQ